MDQKTKHKIGFVLFAAVHVAMVSGLEARQMNDQPWQVAADEPPIAPDPAAESVGESAEDAEVEGEPGVTDAAVVPTEEEAAPLDGATAGVPPVPSVKDASKP
jgi:hypothetical protein